MNRHLSILLALLVLSLSSAAQTSYHTLDSLAGIIRQNNNTVTGTLYSDKEDAYELSFPKDNFGIMASNRLAYHSVYKKKDGKELLYLTENIDLSKAERIELVAPGKDRIVWMVRLWFPKGYLKTQVLDNGEPAGIPAPDYLEFYKYFDSKKLDASTPRSTWPMWTTVKTIGTLCYQFKIDNDQIAAEMVNIITDRFNELLDNKAEDLELQERFLSNFPNSLYSSEIRETYENRKKYVEEVKPASDYIRELFTKYKYKPGLTFQQFISHNTEAGNKLKEKYSREDGATYMPAYTGEVTTGPAMCLEKNGKITYYGYYLLVTNGSNTAPTTSAYQKWVSDIKQIIPAKDIETKSEGNIDYIKVKHPSSGVYVIVYNHHYSKILKCSMLQIGFGTDD